MGVTTLARLPQLTGQGMAPLFAHIQSAHPAQICARWTVTVKAYRSAMPVPVFEEAVSGNAVPADGTAADGMNGDPPASSSGVTLRPKLLWKVSLSEVAGIDFFLVEDPSKPTRPAGAQEDTSNTQAAMSTSPEWRHTLISQPSDGPLPFNPGAIKGVGVPANASGWVPRGSAVTISGVMLEVAAMGVALPNGSSGGTSASDPNGGSSKAVLGSTSAEWKVRIGQVDIGGSRASGAIVEAEFLPLTHLPKDSPLITSFLYALLPPSLIGRVGNLTMPFDLSTVMAFPNVPDSSWSHLGISTIPSEDSAHGWLGSERARRCAFMYVQLLRSEGIV